MNLSFSLRFMFGDPLYDVLLLEMDSPGEVKSGNIAGTPERVQWENLKMDSGYGLLRDVLFEQFNWLVKAIRNTLETYCDSRSATAICIPVISPVKPR